MSNGAPSTPRKKRGCLFYGCLSVAIVAIVLVLMLCLGLYIGKRTLTRLVNDYTDAAPQAIETVTYAPAERTALQERIESFGRALDSGKSGEELILSASDINVLIGENRDMKGKLFVSIEDDQVKGKIAWPLPDIDIWLLKLKGRYLNANVSLRVALESGKLDVRLESAEVRGKALPDQLMSKVKQNNFAEKPLQDPENAKQIEKFSSVQIKDGKVVIRSK